MTNSTHNKLTSYFISKNIHPLFILGTWIFGGHNFGKYNQEDALKTLDFAYKNAIRSFDIASFYSKGNSNKVLAKFLRKKNRNDYILCAKAGLKWNKNTVIFDGSATNINLEIELLLNQFQTNYIDTYLLHWPDPKIKLEESLESIVKLKEKKKVNFIGICNVDINNLKKVKQFNLDTIHIHNNLIKNKKQKEFVTKIKENFHTTIFSIFENGLLTNPKYLNLELIGKKDIRRKNEIHKNKKQKEKLTQLFSKNTAEYTTAECVLIWSLKNLNFDSIIIGPKNYIQIKSILDICKNQKKINNIIKTDFYNFLNTFQFND